jgi:ferredoxin-NADP reductase
VAELKTGKVVHFNRLSPVLALFRLRPAPGESFPAYEPGQYMALRRDNCWLTRKVLRPDGTVEFVPDVDEPGHPRIGSVTHSYTIASSPFESAEQGHLEFYIVLEKDPNGLAGRLSSSLFRLGPGNDDQVTYVNRIAGNFTLKHRAKGFASVLFVGTGTGLAPFVSMVKQLDFEARRGRTDGVQYTLLHTNRTYEELGYHDELTALEAARRFDFLYIPSVSRPSPRDMADPGIGRGRANNLLRHVFGLPWRERQDMEEARARGADAEAARVALERVVAPELPRQVDRRELVRRLDPGRTVILNCGNPEAMADVQYVANRCGLRFEKEDW